jgi:hypothetical protein
MEMKESKMTSEWPRKHCCSQITRESGKVDEVAQGRKSVERRPLGKR